MLEYCRDWIQANISIPGKEGVGKGEDWAFHPGLNPK